MRASCAENGTPHSLHCSPSEVISILLLLVLSITMAITCESFSEHMCYCTFQILGCQLEISCDFTQQKDNSIAAWELHVETK